MPWGRAFESLSAQKTPETTVVEQASGGIGPNFSAR
jgi:hypothetical protein